MDRVFLERLETDCVIGIFKREREYRQEIWIDIEIACDARRAAAHDRVRDAVDYKRVAKAVLAFAAKSRFHLVETLAEKIAALILEKFGAAEVSVTISKPGAVRCSRNVGVKITRGRTPDPDESAFILIGSDTDRRRNFRRAAALLRDCGEVVRVSGVYESGAAGPALPAGRRRGAADFWNAVAQIRTALPPPALRDALRRIERRMGRRRTTDKYAPRAIDLDLLFYGDRAESRAGLVLPHPDAHRMPYALVPMAEIAPGFRHPRLRKTILEILGGLLVPDRFFRRVSGPLFSDPV